MLPYGIFGVDQYILFRVRVYLYDKAGLEYGIRRLSFIYGEQKIASRKIRDSRSLFSADEFEGVLLQPEEGHLRIRLSKELCGLLSRLYNSFASGRSKSG